MNGQNNVPTKERSNDQPEGTQPVKQAAVEIPANATPTVREDTFAQTKEVVGEDR